MTEQFSHNMGAGKFRKASDADRAKEIESMESHAQEHLEDNPMQRHLSGPQTIENVRKYNREERGFNGFFVDSYRQPSGSRLEGEVLLENGDKQRIVIDYDSFSAKAKVETISPRGELKSSEQLEGREAINLKKKYSAGAIKYETDPEHIDDKGHEYYKDLAHGEAKNWPKENKT